MPYSSPLNSTHPGYFLFLIDQSKSMSRQFADRPTVRLAEGVAEAVNRTLQNLVLKCVKDSDVADRLYMSVIGYGGECGPALGGALAAREMCGVRELAENPLRLIEEFATVNAPDGRTAQKRTRRPIWIEPKCEGGTPMYAAFRIALKLVSSFIAKHPDSYPPIVLNITDGRPSDADPQPLIKELRKLHTTDGAALLFNLHLSAASSSQYLFPGICPKTDDPYSTYLFRCSSILPKAMLDIARMQYPRLDDDARGFAYNADFLSLVQFLNIGTTCAV